MTQTEILTKMFNKQNELNIHTNGENWTDKNIPWYRAVWTECAEMIDHTDWKWWKKGEDNLDQLQLELIDIWHFIMSDLLREKENLKNIFNFIIRNFNNGEEEEKTQSIQECIEKLALAALAQLSMLKHFIVLCNKVEITSLEKLYKLYIGKNVLNRFRQDLGYKQGKYIKIWNGKEDNDYMIEKIKDLPIDDNFEISIYAALEDEYKNVLKYII